MSSVVVSTRIASPSLGVALAEILGPGDLLGDDLFLTGHALFRETRNIRLYVLREIFRRGGGHHAAVLFRSRGCGPRGRPRQDQRHSW